VFISVNLWLKAFVSHRLTQIPLIQGNIYVNLLRHRVFALLFFNLTQGRKGAETRRVLSIAVFTSFVLLYTQLTLTEITGFPDSADFFR